MILSTNITGCKLHVSAINFRPLCQHWLVTVSPKQQQKKKVAKLRKEKDKKEGDICLPKKRVYLEVWTGDALGQLFEERYHHFGELCRFYHI